MAELNDNFIGCIHRQLTDRHMLYTKEFTSDGCLAQDTFSGVLKVTVLVFNVLLDNTQYTLTVSGHPVGQGVIAPNFNLMDTVKTAAGNAGASNAAGSADNSCDAESGSCLRCCHGWQFGRLRRWLCCHGWRFEHHWQFFC